ncbi:MAG: 50S ribosomal protein L29 [Pseudomonadales bacterium]|nr:50S ribosomal protein L29 [Pseudomonadales bacterium]
MDATDKADLRGKTADELASDLVRLRKEQFNLRMQRASELLPQTHLITKTRRDIARIKTLIREKASA